MELNHIMDKHPLPSFIGKKIKVIGYEAYRSVGNKLIVADTIDALMTKIKDNKSYPPYQVHIILEAIGGTFSLELGFNSPDFKLVYSPGVWMYYQDLPQDGSRAQIQNAHNHKFKDWYLSLMLTEFVK